MKTASPKPVDVLIVDDDEIVRCALADALEQAGYTVQELPSPIGVTRVVLHHGIRLVVIDLYMPAMRGDSLVRLFRANARLAAVKVVLISGAPEPELRRLATDAGVDAFVPKAAGPGALVAKVRELLGSSR